MTNKSIQDALLLWFSGHLTLFFFSARGPILLEFHKWPHTQKYFATPEATRGPQQQQQQQRRRQPQCEGQQQEQQQPNEGWGDGIKCRKST